MGDAAHATSPWQAAGVGQAVEDVIILRTLMDKATSSREIRAAFQAFSDVRKDRGQQVIDSSRGTGNILTGGVGLDPAKVGAALAGRWKFIFELDIEKHKEDALVTMSEILHSSERK